MKLSRNSIFSFLAGGLLCLTACLSISSSDSEKVLEGKPVVMAMTASPDVPASLDFVENR